MTAMIHYQQRRGATIGNYSSDKKNAKFYGLKLSRNTDADIIAWLESRESVQGYLKSLIRADKAEERTALSGQDKIDKLNQTAAEYMEDHGLEEADSYKERVKIFWDAINHANND